MGRAPRQSSPDSENTLTESRNHLADFEIDQ
jgi:hypothetical protein